MMMGSRRLIIVVAAISLIIGSAIYYIILMTPFQTTIWSAYTAGILGVIIGIYLNLDFTQV